MPRSAVTQQRLRLHLLPLAIAAIVIATVIPIELRPAVAWDNEFDVVDFIDNLLLYAPLGVALHRRRWWAILAAAATLSLAAEVSQMWTFERYASLYDVVANTFGALLGVWAWRCFALRYRSDTHIVMNGFMLTGSLIVALLVLVIWHLPARSATLSSWSKDFGILLGNETTNDRPWRGSIAALTILRGALSSTEVHALMERRIDPRPMPGHAVLYDSPAAVTLNGGAAIRLPSDVSRRMSDAITADGSFTVVARVKTADLGQLGPARIVSFSGDTEHRNFDLGQVQDRVAFRVRTPVSGVNGEDFRAETAGVLLRDTETLLVASYDGGVSRIFVDGSVSARSNLAAKGCTISLLCDSAVPAAWSLLGAVAAVITLVFVPWRGAVPVMIAALLASGTAIASIQFLHLVPSQIARHPWMQYMAFVGAATIGVASIATSMRQSAVTVMSAVAPEVALGGRDH